ncbi:cyanamide hydratase family HD domain-containing protein [Xylogone sp. PMI_703]|nr:cyanamide hydratase family HD domain-containing protein [Xylogone sp. PMI_703]
MSNSTIEKYGWTAVPVDLGNLLSLVDAFSKPAAPVSVSSIPIPDSLLAQEAQKYAQKELPIETFNHSMRVFYYGQAILKQAFPSWSTPSFNETYFLTCLLHDIGTTDKNLHATLMSFEFYGGFIALKVLDSLSAPKEQAEHVAEAVIRHQDLGEKGTISRIGALIQLATLFDNKGANKDLVAKETIEDVVKAYPRRNWSTCFSRTIRKEIELKPWAHSTHLGIMDFPVGVENNELMAPYDSTH